MNNFALIRKLCAVTALICLPVVAADLKKADISTVDLIDQTVNCVDCIDYKIIGVCFWLKCTLTGCSVKESVKVSHYIPDMVVSSYSNKSAWDDTKDWNEVPTGAMSTEQSQGKIESYLDYKSVDIVTHPALAIFNTLGEQDLFCKSQQGMPFVPLFESELDTFWIESTVEGILSTTFGLFRANNIIKSPSEISGMPSIPGLPPSGWAQVYPRCGWGTHPYDPINAAVAAHRASEIVTRTVQPHIYLPASGRCDNRCWKPGPVKANNDENKFQMNYPASEDSAKPFGGTVAWADDKNLSHETYTWSLWRKYKCCEKKGQVFLGDVEL